ncbi:uncharacterized protein ACIBXB_017202 [Morphnus guianensis]
MLFIPLSCQPESEDRTSESQTVPARPACRAGKEGAASVEILPAPGSVESPLGQDCLNSNGYGESSRSGRMRLPGNLHVPWMNPFLGLWRSWKPNHFMELARILMIPTQDRHVQFQVCRISARIPAQDRPGWTSKVSWELLAGEGICFEHPW